MARKKRRREFSFLETIERETLASVSAVLLLGIGIILMLAVIGKAGPAGDFLFSLLDRLVGWGYFLLPIGSIAVALLFLVSHKKKFVGLTIGGMLVTVLLLLGLIDVLFPDKAGIVGALIGLLENAFGKTAAIVVFTTVSLITLLISFNMSLKFSLKPKEKELDDNDVNSLVTENGDTMIDEEDEEEEFVEEEEDEEISQPVITSELIKKPLVPPKDYIPPPLSLLKSTTEKPTSGDLRANANIIKRTLESFGIQVEMNEINIGPKVTRYTLKPAQGVKLTKITALNPDLSLALAAHPIRIEAPIPGKSLVGIEVPNKSAAIVRLGSLMGYEDFSRSGQLSFPLGRDVSGEVVFLDIERMPHMLVAGSTGSGKSITIHSILISLLYKNSPQTLRLILIDPKRVELSSYENIPHLIAPVITDPKKSVGVFRWAIAEMERRYEILLKAGSRDIKSYNEKNKKDPIAYIVVVVDEMADLMARYGREVEGSIVRLAQMARATGIHLILSTQRPSVEVVTGLIKANITARIALQVASQIDSRTILDMSGAEKLLGGGDLLYISSDNSKPKRIQGAYLSESEIKKVTDFIIDNNDQVANEEEGELEAAMKGRINTPNDGSMFNEYGNDEDGDELYDDAVDVVREAGKASSSLLQRRLKIGYARAARLLDIMEERGIVGPGEGAKPREILMDIDDDRNNE